MAGPQGPQGIQGPPGPPGTVAGYVDTANTDVSLNPGLTTVATLNVPAGSFLVTAKAVVFGGVTKNDDVGCDLFDGGGGEVDASYTQLDMQLQCADTATEAIVNHTSSLQCRSRR